MLTMTKALLCIRHCLAVTVSVSSLMWEREALTHLIVCQAYKLSFLLR